MATEENTPADGATNDNQQSQTGASTDAPAQASDPRANSTAATAASPASTSEPPAASEPEAAAAQPEAAPTPAPAPEAAPAAAPAPPQSQSSASAEDEEEQRESGFDFGAILDQYEQEQAQFQEGSVVRGTVVNVNDRGVVIDFGFKSEGLVPLEEFMEQGQVTVKRGDEVEVLIKSMESQEGHARAVARRRRADARVGRP